MLLLLLIASRSLRRGIGGQLLKILAAGDVQRLALQVTPRRSLMVGERRRRRLFQRITPSVDQVLDLVQALGLKVSLSKYVLYSHNLSPSALALAPLPVRHYGLRLVPPVQGLVGRPRGHVGRRWRGLDLRLGLAALDLVARCRRPNAG